MVTDYDKPRSKPEASEHDSLTVLRPARDGGQDLLLEEDTDIADPIDLPGADPSGEVLQSRVLPQQADEFICTRCFLVEHKSRRLSRVCKKKGVTAEM